MIIGICGQSCSGKTTFANNLSSFLKLMNKNLKIIIISMDNFYKGKSKFSVYVIFSKHPDFYHKNNVVCSHI